MRSAAGELRARSFHSIIKYDEIESAEQAETAPGLKDLNGQTSSALLAGTRISSLAMTSYKSRVLGFMWLRLEMR